MGRQVGEASVELERPVSIAVSASVVGTKEGQGPLGMLFDKVSEDDMFGAKNWEEAESTFQKEALFLALKKGGFAPRDIRYLFAGDLLGQSIASSFGLGVYQIPFLGVYGACSTCGEALTLGAMTIDGGFADKVACVTSSHFASAEREFRFPLEYGNQRPKSATWTVTGSGAFILEKSEGKEGVKIMGMTVGKITDYGVKDSMNMGACMAPAAANTLLSHMKDWKRTPEDYDKIITGDLGEVGRTALMSLVKEKGLELSDRHMDCGLEIYETEEQDCHSGGSGCGCCAVTLAAYILKQLREKSWRRVLFMPTGALLSKTSFNEGRTVPGICHALVLESY